MSDRNEAVNRLLEGLGYLWGASCLRLDPDGFCPLRTDDGLELGILAAEQAGQLTLFAEFGTPVTPELALRLLEANADELAPAGFCLEAATGRLLLRASHPFEALSEPVLGNLLSNFVVLARRARTLLARPAQPSAPAMPELAAPMLRFI
ncbi:CesT family type III secretion system chaperone [Chitinimonas koreensis]|uniref:CesT family type III secretion system chaperone n=1 Tax=Chitinimonas koreensis TaxID=356302 RepID=UPI0003F72CF7|nr:CesT family type III secretion system chaperone [Chitinimonas koreensis]QNM95078.1 type III secretion system chaperone [Chitinimonas koreensis]